MALLRVLTTEQRRSNTQNHGDSDLPHRRNGAQSFLRVTTASGAIAG
jgi:hypothetical protein